MTMRRGFSILVLFLFPLVAAGQKRQLTLDDIYDPKLKTNFSGRPQSGFTWIDEKSFLWPKSDSKGEVSEIVLVDAESGKERAFFLPGKMEKALRQVAGMDEGAAKKLVYRRSFDLDPSRTGVILSIRDDLYYYSFSTESLKRLTSTAEVEEEATFSPDGRSIAFIRDHDLFVIDVATLRERRLTRDGSEELLNGKLDWVYQEEIWGRGTFKAYWWSPDSSRIAFLQLDEKRVGSFTVVDHLPTMQKLEVTHYPKAGSTNPTVKLFVVDASGGAPREMDTERYGGADSLIVDVDWKPDSTRVVYQVQNREQTWLDLNTASPVDGTSETLFRETTKAWVEPSGSPTWLRDGSFLWLSERSGWKHLYRYDKGGTLVAAVTSGRWEIVKVHGVDEDQKTVYFTATERNPIGSDVYSIGLDGSNLRRITESQGTHTATFSPKLRYFIDTWSDLTTPAQTVLRSSSGKTIRVIDRNEVTSLSEFQLSTPERVQVKTRDGFVMEAVMLKPPSFDPSKKYPVYEHTYAGPHAPQVRDAWGGTTYLFHQLLAQRGAIVWICDNRTASGKGAESAWPVYKNFGELELRDLEDGVAWLRSQPYVDASRILLNGWSYGGFMVSYALTHSSSFAAGIAGGSVTDWRDYDSIYTERYMLMPQNNPDGYKKSSPRFSAKSLSGRLLLIHGTIDDNVHVQNTLQFAHELQKAGKPFEMMLYPASRHGVTNPELNKHLRMLMLDFVTRTILAPGEAKGSAASAE